jgi:hypothetical protein
MKLSDIELIEVMEEDLDNQAKIREDVQITIHISTSQSTFPYDNPDFHMTIQISTSQSTFPHFHITIHISI